MNFIEALIILALVLVFILTDGIQIPSSLGLIFDADSIGYLGDFKFIP